MYNSVVISHKLSWSPDVQGDLDAVWEKDEADGLFIEELFDLLVENDKILECLASGRFRQIEDPRFDAGPVLYALRARYNIYYLKTWRRDGALVPWRVFYAVHHRTAKDVEIRILGLMERVDDYEPTSDFCQRVHADYDRHGIPRLPSC